MADKKRMIFIEEPFVRGQLVHKQGLEGMIVFPIRCQAQAAEDATSVGIDDKDRFPGSVKNYGIGCLFTNTGNREELPAEGGNIQGEESSQVIPPALTQCLGQGLKLKGLGIVITYGVNHLCQPFPSEAP